MALLFGVILVLLSVHNSLQAPENSISIALKKIEGCKNIKDCEVPKLSAITLDKFPEKLKKDVEMIVKTVVVLEQQTKKTDQKIGDALMNTVILSLDACRRAQKAYTAAYNRVQTEKANALKMIKGVVEVTLSKDNKMSCVVVPTLEKYSREQCQVCQRMIPDFLDGPTAEEAASTIVKSLTMKAPSFVKDYLNSIKTFAGNAAEYMDKLVVCVQSGKNIESCRDKSTEGTLITRMGTLFNMGKQVISFMSTIGTTISTEIQGFIGRVTTTHKVYKQCLLSGAAVSANITGHPVETSIIDVYEGKVKDQMKPLKDVATRALQTKLRMLRERKMQRTRSLVGRRNKMKH